MEDLISTYWIVMKDHSNPQDKQESNFDGPVSLWSNKSKIFEKVMHNN